MRPACCVCAALVVSEEVWETVHFEWKCRHRRQALDHSVTPCPPIVFLTVVFIEPQASLHVAITLAPVRRLVILAPKIGLYGDVGFQFVDYVGILGHRQQSTLPAKPGEGVGGGLWICHQSLH